MVSENSEYSEELHESDLQPEPSPNPLETLLEEGLYSGDPILLDELEWKRIRDEVLEFARKM